MFLLESYAIRFTPNFTSFYYVMTETFLRSLSPQKILLARISNFLRAPEVVSSYFLEVNIFHEATPGAQNINLIANE